MYHLAVSRVRVAGPQRGRRGQFWEEQAETALKTTFLRRTVSVCGVKAQAFSLPWEDLKVWEQGGQLQPGGGLTPSS